MPEKGSAPNATGPQPGSPTSSSHVDGRQRVGGLDEGQPGRDASPCEAGAVLLEQEAVGARDGEQVDVGVEPDGAGDHRRVPVSSWAMPPDSVVRCASGNPAARNIVDERRSGSGR